MAQDRRTRVRVIATPTSQLISDLVHRHTNTRRYPLETHLFSLTKSSQFRNNIQNNTVHNLWPILQILNGIPAVCKDPDTPLIRVESMIESSTGHNLKTEQWS
ncbi:hypothetical protein TNCV_2531601 [Trichonephila clavipes]|nr:hypothetical protein TNCV_2531601 [Trichonephila clavipes]